MFNLLVFPDQSNLPMFVFEKQKRNKKSFVSLMSVKITFITRGWESWDNFITLKEYV
jgi:hypothetical protein